MIRVRDLMKWLKKVDEDAEVYAYEGEDTGIVIKDLDHSNKFIRATQWEDEFHVEGFEDEEMYNITNNNLHNGT